MLLRLVAIVCAAPKVYAISASEAASDSSATDQSANSVQAASVANGGLSTEGVSTLDGVALDSVAEGRSAEAILSTSIPTTDWTVIVDSYQPDHPPSNMLDDNLDTFWHTTYTPGASPLERTGVSKFQRCSWPGRPFLGLPVLLWLLSESSNPGCLWRKRC